jgi:hypothetical protein
MALLYIQRQGLATGVSSLSMVSHPECNLFPRFLVGYQVCAFD